MGVSPLHHTVGTGFKPTRSPYRSSAFRAASTCPLRCLAESYRKSAYLSASFASFCLLAASGSLANDRSRFVSFTLAPRHPLQVAQGTRLPRHPRQAPQRDRPRRRNRGPVNGAGRRSPLSLNSCSPAASASASTPLSPPSGSPRRPDSPTASPSASRTSKGPRTSHKEEGTVARRLEATVRRLEREYAAELALENLLEFVDLRWYRHATPRRRPRTRPPRNRPIGPLSHHATRCRPPHRRGGFQTHPPPGPHHTERLLSPIIPSGAKRSRAI